MKSQFDVHGFVVFRSRSCRFSAPRVGRMGVACLDGIIGAEPRLAKGASHVGTVQEHSFSDLK